MGNAWFFPSISNSTRKCSKIHPGELSGCFSTVLLFLIVPKSIDSLKEKTGKVNSFLKKKEKPNPSTLEFKAKYNKRRRENVCNFIKNKEYKYIIGKRMPPILTQIFFYFQ